jgi:hypothetical protein
MRNGEGASRSPIFADPHVGLGYTMHNADRNGSMFFFGAPDVYYDVFPLARIMLTKQKLVLPLSLACRLPGRRDEHDAGTRHNWPAIIISLEYGHCGTVTDVVCGRG